MMLPNFHPVSEVIRNLLPAPEIQFINDKFTLVRRLPTIIEEDKEPVQAEQGE